MDEFYRIVYNEDGVEDVVNYDPSISLEQALLDYNNLVRSEDYEYVYLDFVRTNYCDDEEINTIRGWSK